MNTWEFKHEAFQQRIDRFCEAEVQTSVTFLSTNFPKRHLLKINPKVVLGNFPLIIVFSEMESLYDVTLIADNQTIDAHRSVLSQASLFFKRAFENVNFSHKMVLPITIVSYEVLVAIVKFIYTGRVDVAKQQMGKFIAALRTFGINFDPETIASSVNRAVKRRDSSQSHEIKRRRLTMHVRIRAAFEDNDGCLLEVQPQSTINDVMHMLEKIIGKPLTGYFLTFEALKLDGCASLADLCIPDHSTLLLTPSQ